MEENSPTRGWLLAVVGLGFVASGLVASGLVGSGLVGSPAAFLIALIFLFVVDLLLFIYSYLVWRADPERPSSRTSQDFHGTRFTSGAHRLGPIGQDQPCSTSARCYEKVRGNLANTRGRSIRRSPGLSTKLSSTASEKAPMGNLGTLLARVLPARMLLSERRLPWPTMHIPTRRMPHPPKCWP